MINKTLRSLACGGLSGLALAALFWFWSFPTSADAFRVARSAAGTPDGQVVPFSPSVADIAPVEAQSAAQPEAQPEVAERQAHPAVEATAAEPAAEPTDPTSDAPFPRRRRRASDRFVVPDFVTGNLRAARELAREQRIRLVAEDDFGRLPRRGHAGLYDYVLEQTPEAGEEVAGNTAIQLYIENAEAMEGY